jgi:hypothetical protein
MHVGEPICAVSLNCLDGDGVVGESEGYSRDIYGVELLSGDAWIARQRSKGQC